MTQDFATDFTITDEQVQALNARIATGEEASTMTTTTQTTPDTLTTEALASFTFHMGQWMAQAETATAYMDEQRKATRHSEKWEYLDKHAARWHRYARESASKQNTIGMVLYKSGTLTAEAIAEAMHNATEKAEAQRPAILIQIRKDTKGMKDTSI